jgi:hypothetical protein
MYRAIGWSGKTMYLAGKTICSARGVLGPRGWFFEGGTDENLIRS